MSAPDKIWVNINDSEDGCCPVEDEHFGDGRFYDPDTATEYRRANLPPTLSAAMGLPEVVALVETAQWARNRLEIIADESWHGDGRDLKRSIIGIFADFDKALADCGSQVPLSLASIKEPKT